MLNAEPLALTYRERLKPKNKLRFYNSMKVTTKNWDDALLIFFGALSAIYLEKSLAFGLNPETITFWGMLFGLTLVGITILRLFAARMMSQVDKWAHTSN